MKPATLKILIVLLFSLSGICGLIYEVAWSKYLALFIGSTAYSHMIVLATFMGGLALGAFYWGKFADKSSNQLKLYGILEIAIGIYCFAYPIIINLAENFFINTATSMNGASNQVGLIALKFILSFFTLIVPTFFMGGTLPILTKFLTKNIADAGKDVATLYYINSLGAVIGSAIAGFFLIQWLALDGAVWSAASLNILIGLAAVFLAKFIKIDVPSKTIIAESEQKPTQHFSQKTVRLAVITAALSGFIAMLYELTWIRLLSNILGSSTYSFTVMLIAFISGITLGSWIVSLIIKKVKNLVMLLGICQFGTAISMILTLPLYERLPYYLLKITTLITNRPGNFPIFLGCEFLFCFMIMILPTTFSGMSLPVASRIASNDIRLLGKSIGGVFSINTVGTVIGALATGLIFIPTMGVKLSIEIGVLLNGLLGLTILFIDAKLTSRWRIGYAIFFILIAMTYRIQFPTWNKFISIAGVFRTFFLGDPGSFEDFKKVGEGERKILWYKEGVNANVAVTENPIRDTVQRSLVINGKADASTISDLQNQVLVSQIPLMLLPDSGAALVIGLGSGITCGSALRHSLRSLDCVEIASEVAECNYYFATENYDILRNPRVKLYIDDAITYLKITPKKYNFIISEPSNPWIAGIGNLFSQEFFELCKKRLEPGGVLTQWFHAYDINDKIFEIVLCTISRSFPFITVWKVSDADIIILASMSPITLNFDAMERKMKFPPIAADLSRVGIYDVPALLSTQIVSARNNTFAFRQSDLNTEKRPLLEFMAPKSLFTHESVTMIDSIDERISVQDKNLWLTDYEKQHGLSLENYLNIARYRNSEQIGDLGFVYTTLKKCLQLSPKNEEALGMMARVSRDMDLREERRGVLRTLSELYPDDVEVISTYATALIEVYRIEGSIINPQEMNDAVELLRRCVRLTEGREERYHIMLAITLTGAERFTEAAEVYKDLLEFQKEGETTSDILPEAMLIYRIGDNYYNAGNLQAAEEYLKRAKQLDPGNVEASIMLNKISLKKRGIR